MIGPLTYVDIVVIVVCFISAMLAMYRGLTRELLSVMSWALALGVTVLSVQYDIWNAADIAQQLGTPVVVAHALLGGILFVIVLVVVHLITSRISDATVESRVGMVDRILGFVFGIARGFLLIVIPYMFYASFFPDESTHFPWVRDSISTPYLRDTGASIRSFLEENAPTSLSLPEQPSGDGAE